MLLINPPSSFLLDERVFPSLGILKVAAVLERAGHAVELIDLAGDDVLAALKARLAHPAPACVGLSATTAQMPAVKEIVGLLRRAWPKTRIVLGGPHGTLALAARRKEAKRNVVGRGHRAIERLVRMVDCLVAGDGEHAVFAAMQPDAPEIVDADDRKSALWMKNDHYEASPWPARHLIDIASYRYQIDGHRATSIIGQLGCPFACAFCGGRHAHSLRVIRTRSTGNIVGEVRHLYEEHGFTGFMFYDDELNVSPALVEMCEALTDLQEELGVSFGLRGFIKAELFNEDQARAMRRAGFRWLLCGFEAADDRILINIAKRATRADNDRVLELAGRHDLKIKALMSVGHAGESEASVRAVRNWLLDVAPADFDCTIITPYPGTPYHDDAEPAGNDVWTYTQPVTGDRLHAREIAYEENADYYKGIPGEYVSHVFTDHLSAEDLVRLRDELEREVRGRLNIPYPSAAPAQQFEHSMGQT